MISSTDASPLIELSTLINPTWLAVRQSWTKPNPRHTIRILNIFAAYSYWNEFILLDQSSYNKVDRVQLSVKTQTDKKQSLNDIRIQILITGWNKTVITSLSWSYSNISQSSIFKLQLVSWVTSNNWRRTIEENEWNTQLKTTHHAQSFKASTTSIKSYHIPQSNDWIITRLNKSDVKQNSLLSFGNLYNGAIIN